MRDSSTAVRPDVRSAFGRLMAIAGIVLLAAIAGALIGIAPLLAAEPNGAVNQQKRVKTSPLTKKVQPFKPILHKQRVSLALTGPPDKSLPSATGALPATVVRKLFRKRVVLRPGRPYLPRPPMPPAPDCPCNVTMGLSPAKPDNVFFTDEAVTASYAIDCASEAVIGQIRFTDYAAALAAAEKGQTIDDPGGGTIYRENSPQWPGILSGSKPITGGAPGLYSWYVGASNTLNNSSSSQTLVFQVVARPATTGCTAYQGCLDKWVQFIKPRIAAQITNNAALDQEVEAFRDKVYDRQVIGLRLERDVMATGGITCVASCEGSGISTNQVTIDFCPNAPPTDYALLHELVHRAGFDNRLIQAYVNKGLGPPTKTQVEVMTAHVAAAVFTGVGSRTCAQY
jgi:hypothetical protein